MSLGLLGLCQSSIKKDLERKNTVLRPRVLTEGFYYYKQCTILLNQTNQPITQRHSSPSLSHRLSLGNGTFRQEKKLLFDLLGSSPQIIQHWGLVCLYLPPSQTHKEAPQSLLKCPVSHTDRTAGQLGTGATSSGKSISRADLNKLITGNKILLLCTSHSRTS